MTKTYGKVSFVGEMPGATAKWIIDDLTPHVAIAFKRLFPRVRTDATKILLADGDDIRADLLWFMQRYPLETRCMPALEFGAKRAADRLAERDRILLPDWEPGEIRGFNPGYAPYLYQTQAAQIALNNGGLLLGDEVGLGKTITAAAMLCMGAPMPAGIVVQAHLAEQWKEKLVKFTTLRVHIIKGTSPYTLPKADVYIFRYSNIGGWIDFLKNGFLKTVIYDEIQELRHGSDTAKGRCCAIVSAQAKLRLGLTATPIYNHGDEMHTVLSYIQPHLLGDRDEFLREWCKGSGIVTDPDGLGSYLRETGWFLRRDENDPSVDKAMPPPNVLTCTVDWDTGAVADEQAMMKKLAIAVVRGSFMEAGKAARELDLKMRHMTGVAKARSVAAYVRLVLRAGAPRVLLAGWHRDVYAMWMKDLAEFQPVLYTGSESAAGKAFTVSAFTQGDSRVMFISLRSGVGLDGLQHNCRDVVFGELDWSPQVHHQIVGRLRRPGQSEQVNAHYPLADEGSDPVLVEMLGVKSDQSRGIIDPGAAAKVTEHDDTRIKRMAKFVLEGVPEAEREPCAICGQPSTGEVLHIVPLEDLEDYEEEDQLTLLGAENEWRLCAEHAAGLQQWQETGAFV